MRTIVLFLVCITAIAQSPPATPQNLRLVMTTVDDGIVPVPVIATNGLFMAVWYSPPYILRTNAYVVIQPVAYMWIPEISTDGVNWSRGTDLAYLPSREIRAVPQPCYTCLHLTQTVSLSDQVRIRRISY